MVTNAISTVFTRVRDVHPGSRAMENLGIALCRRDKNDTIGFIRNVAERITRLVLGLFECIPFFNYPIAAFDRRFIFKNHKVESKKLPTAPITPPIKTANAAPSPTATALAIKTPKPDDTTASSSVPKPEVIANPALPLDNATTASIVITPVIDLVITPVIDSPKTESSWASQLKSVDKTTLKSVGIAALGISALALLYSYSGTSSLQHAATLLPIATETKVDFVEPVISIATIAAQTAFTTVSSTTTYFDTHSLAQSSFERFKQTHPAKLLAIGTAIAISCIGPFVAIKRCFSKAKPQPQTLDININAEKNPSDEAQHSPKAATPNASPKHNQGGSEIDVVPVHLDPSEIPEASDLHPESTPSLAPAASQTQPETVPESVIKDVVEDHSPKGRLDQTEMEADANTDASDTINTIKHGVPVTATATLPSQTETAGSSSKPKHIRWEDNGSMGSLPSISESETGSASASPRASRPQSPSSLSARTLTQLPTDGSAAFGTGDMSSPRQPSGAQLPSSSAVPKFNSEFVTTVTSDVVVTDEGYNAEDDNSSDDESVPSREGSKQASRASSKNASLDKAPAGAAPSSFNPIKDDGYKSEDADSSDDESTQPREGSKPSSRASSRNASLDRAQSLALTQATATSGAGAGSSLGSSSFNPMGPGADLFAGPLGHGSVVKSEEKESLIEEPAQASKKTTNAGDVYYKSAEEIRVKVNNEKIPSEKLKLLNTLTTHLTIAIRNNCFFKDVAIEQLSFAKKEIADYTSKLFQENIRVASKLKKGLASSGAKSTDSLTQRKKDYSISMRNIGLAAENGDVDSNKFLVHAYQQKYSETKKLQLISKAIFYTNKLISLLDDEVDAVDIKKYRDLLEVFTNEYAENYKFDAATDVPFSHSA